MLAPFILYVFYISITKLSLRDYGVNIASRSFTIGLLSFTLITLLLPTIMASGMLRRKSIAVGILQDEHHGRTRSGRFLAAFLMMSWNFLALGLLLLPVSWVLLSFVLVDAPDYNIAQVNIIAMGLLLLAIPLIPVLWLRKRPEQAPFHLAIARSMMTVYAALALFFAMLVLVSATAESHFIRIDQVMAPMNQRDIIVPNMVEGRVVIMLRDDVREGATKLDIPWR
jgi:drug/metabolite transporter (DMT)-like permease